MCTALTTSRGRLLCAFWAPLSAPQLLPRPAYEQRPRLRPRQHRGGHVGRRNAGHVGGAWSVDHLKIDDRDPTARRRLRLPRLMSSCLHSEHSLRSSMQARDSSPSFRWQQDAAAPARLDQQPRTRHTRQRRAGTRDIRRADCSRAARGREGAPTRESKLVRAPVRALAGAVSSSPIRCSSLLHPSRRHNLPRDRYRVGGAASAHRPAAWIG